jgi:ADP-heptose:LPS heptosyltransferase
LISLINDADLFIGSPSGPYQIALMTHTPAIILTNEKFKRDTFETYPEYYGNSAYEWIDWNQTIHLDNYDKEKVGGFIKKLWK